MAGYTRVWVTDRLAVGRAPMSFDDIESIRTAGIDGIVNLCAEYCDLADIERQSGFEVFYLPIEDDGAPNLEEMEKALDWLDEAVYLGKKVLVHCRLGIGRTGTFVTSYLLRRGFGLKLAKKALHRVRSTPSSFYQWRLLRSYDKKSKKLTIREPSLEAKNLVDLEPYFSEYQDKTQLNGSYYGLFPFDETIKSENTEADVPLAPADLAFVELKNLDSGMKV